MASRFSYHMYLVCSLEELYLSGNAYEDFTLNIPAYPSLRLLQLTSNKLTDWRYVVKLDRIFPNLRNLTLARNKIEQCGNFLRIRMWLDMDLDFKKISLSFQFQETFDLESWHVSQKCYLISQCSKICHAFMACMACKEFLLYPNASLKSPCCKKWT